MSIDNRRGAHRPVPRARSKQSSQPVPHNPVRLIRILLRLAGGSGNQRKLESILIKLHPADISDAMRQLPIVTNRIIIESLFTLKKAGHVLAELPSHTCGEILSTLPASKASEIIRRLDPDDAVDVLQSLDEEAMHAVMSALNIEVVTEIEQLLLYGEDSAGGLMTTEMVTVRNDLTAAEALTIVKSHKDLEGYQYIYVVDQWDKLVGTLDFKAFLFSAGDEAVSDLINPNVFTVRPQTPAEDVAREISKYDLLEIPVVDANGQLIGIITVDDVIDVIQETATEEIYAIAGLDEDDRVFSGAGRSIRLRLPWLAVNLGTAMLAASVVGHFEKTIAGLVILATVFPIVASTGGNAAIQTITVIIRGFTLGELSMSNATKAIAKELTVGLANGIIVGSVAALVIYMWHGNLILSGIVFGSLTLNFLNASIVGTMIPIAMKRFRLDPAVTSGIFVTAFTDIGGYAIFFALAALFADKL